MKDGKDTKTGDLLTAEKYGRQARYRQRQEAAGLRQFSAWLTPDEAAKVREFIEKMRGA